jgi:hypothetical protein
MALEALSSGPYIQLHWSVYSITVVAPLRTTKLTACGVQVPALLS